jgi:hypothetical protein
MSYVVTMAQAFDTKRMETFDTMQQVLQANPDLINIIGDIFFRNSDLAGADQLADRFKKMLPPQLQDDSEDQIPPQAKAAIQHGQQQVQALNEACKHYEGVIQSLEFEKKAQIVKSQAEFAMRKMEIEADITKAEITTKAQNSNERITFVEDMVKQIMSQSHDSAMAAQQATHAQDAQDQQAANQSDLAAQQGQQQSQQSAQDAQQSQEAQAAQPAE